MVLLTKSDNSTGLAVFHLSSAGATSVTAFQQQTTTSGPTTIRGIGVDPSGSLFVAYDCSASPSSPTVTSYLRKYSSSLALLGARVLPTPYSSGTPTFNQSALALDAAGNVYVAGADNVNGGANDGTYAVVTKYANDATSSPVWQHWTSVPKGSAGGPLTLDGSGHLTCLPTYVAGSDPNVHSTYLVQFDQNGNLLWSGPAVQNAFATDAALDSNSDVIFVGCNISNLQTNPYYYYTVAKLSGQTGALDWQTSISPNPTGASQYGPNYPSLMVDAGNDAYVVGSSSWSTFAKIEVDRFASASGQDIGTYVYNSGNSASRDFGVALFSWSSVFTYFVAGVGSPAGNGTFYPLAFRFGTGCWQDYQTATTP